MSAKRDDKESRPEFSQDATPSECARLPAAVAQKHPDAQRAIISFLAGAQRLRMMGNGPAFMLRDFSTGNGVAWLRQEKAALRKIAETFDGDERLPILRSLYLAINEIGNDERSDLFEAAQPYLAGKAGISVATLKRYLPLLEAIGAIAVFRKRVRGLLGFAILPLAHSELSLAHSELSLAQEQKAGRAIVEEGIIREKKEEPLLVGTALSGGSTEGGEGARARRDRKQMELWKEYSTIDPRGKNDGALAKKLRDDPEKFERVLAEVKSNLKEGKIPNKNVGAYFNDCWNRFASHKRNSAVRAGQARP